jgi:5-methylcytosine-specific restriction enzyme subunit McrC
MIYLFASNLYEHLNNGINRSYIAVEEESRYLKGQWLLPRQIAEKPFCRNIFLIRYDEFTEDNYLNRILKFTTNLLVKYARDISTKRLLNDILFAYSDVGDLGYVSEEYINKVQFNRLNEEYKKIFDFALVFIRHLNIQLMSGKNDTYSFMFDMNVLFEEFIAEFIKQESLLRESESYKDCVLNVKRQRHLSEMPKLFKMEPDICIQNKSVTKLIIDTKYKLLDDCDRRLGVSQADMYQMFAYSHKFNCKRVVLLYPEHNLYLNESRHKPMTYKIDKCDNNDNPYRRVEIWTVDLRGDWHDTKLPSSRTF